MTEPLIKIEREGFMLREYPRSILAALTTEDWSDENIRRLSADGKRAFVLEGHGEWCAFLVTPATVSTLVEQASTQERLNVSDYGQIIGQGHGTLAEWQRTWRKGAQGIS